MSALRRFPAAALAAAVAVVMALSFPTPASAAAAGELTITNTDVLPGDTAAVMSKIQTPADSSQRMHDKVTLKLANTGTASLRVESLTTSGPFTVTSPWRLPFTLSAGSSVSLTVAFTASSGDWHTGSTTVGYHNGEARTTAVSLTGWWQKYSEKGLEPRLGDLVRNLGYGTAMPSAIYSRGAYQAFSADEVLSPYWVALDAGRPLRITQLAAWRGYPSNVVVRKHARGGTQTYSVFSGLKNDAQSVYPRNTSWARGTATFTVGGPVGLQLDDEFTDPAKNNDSVDLAAGCTATRCGHHVRVFQARTSSGELMPGAYLLAQDFGGINYDYNDNVFLLENVKPA